MLAISWKNVFVYTGLLWVVLSPGVKERHWKIPTHEDTFDDFFSEILIVKIPWGGDYVFRKTVRLTLSSDIEEYFHYEIPKLRYPMHN